jgi:hypothetical protein
LAICVDKYIREWQYNVAKLLNTEVESNHQNGSNSSSISGGGSSSGRSEIQQGYSVQRMLQE